jgi:hypothetical protein
MLCVGVFLGDYFTGREKKTVTKALLRAAAHRQQNLGLSARGRVIGVQRERSGKKRTGSFDGSACARHKHFLNCLFHIRLQVFLASLFFFTLRFFFPQPFLPNFQCLNRKKETFPSTPVRVISRRQNTVG